MHSSSRIAIDTALATLPRVTALLTSAFDGERAGLLVHRVVSCSDDPPCVCAVARKGHPIAPLIRDSRHFALCLMDGPSRLLERYFDLEAHGDFDPFDGFRVVNAVSGAPILADAVLAFDCEVVRHFDLESDFELYIGHVIAVRQKSSRGVARRSESADGPAPSTPVSQREPPQRAGKPDPAEPA